MSKKKHQHHRKQQSVVQAISADTPVQDSPAASKINPLRLKRILAAIVVFAAFLLYFDSLRYDFTLDDGAVISNNTIVKQGVAGIPELLVTSYWKGISAANVQSYRPLSMVMYAIEWELSPDNPGLHHAVNVILFTLTGLMLFFTLTSLFSDRNFVIPFIAAVLFISHPIHTEVTASIKSRDEILSFLLILTSGWLLLNFIRTGKPLIMAVACVSYFLALLSKENAITFVVIAPLLIWYFTDADLKKNILTTALLAGMAGIYMIIRANVLDTLAGVGTDAINSLDNVLVSADKGEQLATAVYILGKYLYLLIIPHPLVSDYSYAVISVIKWSDYRALLPLLIHLVLAWIAVKGFMKKNIISFAILFYAITIALIANILFITQCAMAERFLYLPSFGFSLVSAVLLAKLFRSEKQTVVYQSIFDFFKKNGKLFGVTAVIFALYSFKTITRGNEWKDNYTLFSTDASTHPKSARTHFNFGADLLIKQVPKEKEKAKKKVLLKQAEEELVRAATIYQDYFSAYLFLAAAYYQLEAYDKAIQTYLLAEKYSPKDTLDASFYYDMGNAYGKSNQYEMAYKFLDYAASLKKDYYEAYTSLGYYYGKNGRYDKALEYLNKAIKIKPDHAEAYNYLGTCYGGQGKYNEALGFYQKAISILPTYADAYNNLATTYGMLKDYQNALKNFKKAIEEEPDNAQYYYFTGITCQYMGDTVNAKIYLDKSAELNSSIVQ